MSIHQAIADQRERLWQSPPVVAVKNALRSLVDVQRFIRFSFQDTSVTRQPVLSVPKTLLLIRLEGIGDYILFHDFLRSLKASKRYADYRITLCGNESFKTFAEYCDADVVANFIWINPKRLKSDGRYRRVMFREIRRRGFETVLYPFSSRDVLTGDSIVRISGARETVTCNGDNVHSPFWQQRRMNAFYTRRIDISPSTVFEFYRNKECIEAITGEPSLVQRPTLPAPPAHRSENRYAVLCPGALLAKKRWPLERFLEIAIYLHAQYQLESVFVGDKNDIPSPTMQRKLAECSYVKNKIAKTTFVETIALVQHSSLVVTNDTSVSHIGVAAQKPTVILSNGEHYGRFSEYPKEIHPAVFYAYPPEIADSKLSFDELVSRFQYGSRLDIKTISVETVQRLVDKAVK